MVRLNESQRDRDEEVCRFAQLNAGWQIWSTCPTVTNTVELPKFPYRGENYEPDVYFIEVRPPPHDHPWIHLRTEWICEVETEESINESHTHKQMRAFTDYLGPTRVVVLVPNDVLEQMKVNLELWGLSGIVEAHPWGWDPYASFHKVDTAPCR